MKANLTGMLKNHWFLKIRQERAGRFSRFFGLESRIFSYVLLKCDVEMVEITICLDGFRHARAAGARMGPAWYYFTWILTSCAS